MSDVSDSDVERANFAFSIYDFDGSGTVDAFYLGDLLRALDLNPTNALIEKMGGTKKKDEKKLSVEEFLPIFSQVRKDKDQGVYEDFIECLKLYDKAEDGTMLGAELYHILLSLGERLTDKEVDEIMKECCEEEDDDGMIPYVHSMVASIPEGIIMNRAPTWSFNNGVTTKIKSLFLHHQQ